MAHSTKNVCMAENIDLIKICNSYFKQFRYYLDPHKETQGKMINDTYVV
jgi:hypothetical protein